MATFLFDEIIFGPVNSRRLGASLGINLLPSDCKFCNFNCIYCECGWSTGSVGKRLPSRKEVKSGLNEKLKQMHSAGEAVDTITFAGNGEPTLHPEFADIIDDTLNLRQQWYPNSDVAVLSNATRLDKPEIFNALQRIDQNILKLDSAFDETVAALNQPPKGYSVKKVIEGMKKLRGRFILQTLFVAGSYREISIDNSSESEVEAWLKVVEELHPQMVMIYTIARDTPIDTLSKVTADRLDEIAAKVEALYIPTQVSY